MMSGRLPNRNQGLVTVAARFYLQPLFVRVTRQASGPSLIGDTGRDSEYHNSKLLQAGLHMHGYLHDASAVKCARWAIYRWNYWEAHRKGNGHLSGDSSLSATAMGTNDGAAEGSIEATSISITVEGYDCQSTTVITCR